MTSAQILAALQISNLFELLNLTAPYNTGEFTDITDWAALNISSGGGDTVKIIAKVVNPVGITVHENAGYATDSYTSPDTDLTSLTSDPFTLANLTGTHTAVDGNYTFYLKCQVTPNGQAAIEVEKQFSVELNQNIIPSLSLGETYNCNNATYTSVDSTDYATPATQQGFTITNITRVHVTQPPLNSTKSDGTTPQTSVSSSSQTNLLAADDNPLWTGSYQSSIQPTVTYRKGNDYTTIRVPVYTEAVTVACDEDLCELFCCLRTLISSYNTYRSTNTAKAQEFLAKWDAGNRYLIAIREAKACNNGDLVTSYTALFYAVTECDPDCDCGCTDGPAPVIPTVSINGADGTDGSQILTGTTAPSGATGAVGDYYINTTNGFLYKKTGLSAWTYLFTMIGATGATGATGAAGASGTSLIHSDPVNHLTTTNGSYQTLSSFSTDKTNDAKNLVNVGDTIRQRAVFTFTSNPTATGIGVQLLVNGTGIVNVPLNGWSSISADECQVVAESNIVLVDDTAGAMIIRVDLTTTIYKYVGVVGSATITQQLDQFKIVLSNVGGATVDFSANDYTFSAQANSVANGDVYLQLYQAEKLTAI